MFCYQCEMSSPDGCGSNGKQIVGVCGKDENMARLQDLMVFGVKGLSAYREHGNELGADNSSVDSVMAESMYFTLTNVNFNFDDHIGQLMKLGKAGVDVMGNLSEAHTSKLGVPTPVTVTQNKAEGKAILVSGHNLDALKKLLEQTEGKGVNVYTHSEMLPAHGYPELKKYSHLKGNIGKAWFDQSELFNHWPGSILVTTNCIVPLHEESNYADRIYGYKIVNVDGIKMVKDDNFAPLIDKALSSPDVSGFDSDETLTTGHHYKTILSLAPQILDAINGGKIKRFFVIAGCDSPTSGRDYFRELAEKVPQDCVIVTSSCGKFRFNDIDFGNIPGTDIPRYLDLGQCNDSNGAVEIALALSNATGIAVNDLPISIALMWMEQKAVIILLALLSLGIQNIYIGPRAPQFLNHDITNFLVQNFNIKITSNATSDMAAMLG
ncbi:MAG: hydroxylamine reductase [Nitrospinae bacterium]|nr:hydroxylamine reductase [Nitrospinota bacterium]